MDPTSTPSPLASTASHGRSRRRLRIAGLGALLLLTGWSCTLRENQHYRLTGGTRLYATIYSNPSWQIAGQLYRGYCRSNIDCTARFLLAHGNIEGWGAAEFYDGIRDYADFWPAVEYVARQGHDDFLDQGNACLVLTKSLTGNLDWETRLLAHVDCRPGQEVTL